MESQRAAVAATSLHTAERQSAFFGFVDWPRYLTFGVVIVLVLGVTRTYSASLFHMAAEITWVVAAFAMLAMAVSLREFVADDYPVFLGVTLSFTALLHLAHMLSYEMIPHAPLHYTNLTVQLWVAGQYLGSGSLLLAPLALGRRLRLGRLVAIYSALVLVLVAAILAWHVFPTAIGSNGLSTFKIVSEYICAVALAGALALTYRRRAVANPAVLRLMALALLSAIASGLTFTVFRQFDSFFFTVGNLLMVVSIYSIFVAVTRGAIANPAASRQEESRRNERTATAMAQQAFDDLHESEQRQRWLFDDSVMGVFAFDSDLIITECNERLGEILGAPGTLVGFDLGRLTDLTVKKLLTRALCGEQGSYEGPYRSVSGGRDVCILLRVAPLYGTGGETSGAIAVIADLTKSKRAEELVERLAFHDAVTGLANRTLLRDRLRQAIDGAESGRAKIAVAVLNVDRFKLVNDSLGHSSGDRLLQAIAERLRQVLRTGDTLARISGDEFAILRSKGGSSKTTQALMRRVVELCREPWEIGGERVHATVSLGVAYYPDDATDAQTVLDCADTAMRRAKDLGGDALQYYDPTMNRNATEQLTLERDLRIALDEEQFVVYYQPQVDLRSGEIVGAEALVRWQHPERGLVPPGEFIPLAEETGLIGALGVWVVRSACAHAVVCQEHSGRPLRLAVNISARRLHSPDLVTNIRTALEESGLPPGQLEIEITETAIMVNEQVAGDALRALRDIGVTIALDDFGTGFSSLSHLHRLPIDRIKIDRSFISRVEHDADAAAIVAGLTNLAHDLALGVVAEGVETEAELGFLQRLGCDEAQGFLFARPMPAHECEVALMEQAHLVASA